MQLVTFRAHMPQTPLYSPPAPLIPSGWQRKHHCKAEESLTKWQCWWMEYKSGSHVPAHLNTNPASISHPSFVQEESCTVGGSNQDWLPGALIGRSQGKIGGNAQCRFRTLRGTRQAAFKFPRWFKFSLQTKKHRLLNPLLLEINRPVKLSSGPQLWMENGHKGETCPSPRWLPGLPAGLGRKAEQHLHPKTNLHPSSHSCALRAAAGVGGRVLWWMEPVLLATARGPRRKRRNEKLRRYFPRDLCRSRCPVAIFILQLCPTFVYYPA